MTDDTTASLIATLWVSFRPVVEARIAAVDAGLAALGAGAGAADPAVRDAHLAAHSLAGALGSYGRPHAGATAREVMIGLESTAPDVAALRVLLARLAGEVQ